jgi:transcriptional regulator with XRE-family HTH domain
MSGSNDRASEPVEIGPYRIPGFLFVRLPPRLLRRPARRGAEDSSQGCSATGPSRLAICVRDMHAGKVRSMAGIGLRLRTIRQQWQLSLREVEERSLRFAQERGSQSYRVSASWLDRLEREEHELTVNKLVVLAHIYNLPTEQLLRSIDPGDSQPMLPRLSSLNATMLLTEGSLEEPARYLLPHALAPDQQPEETTLVAADSRLTAPYRRGIIGKRDRTLDPMIPAGSIVQIDTRKRTISSRRDWTHEFHRPIYFLTTRDAYVCGWCELDRDSDWLTLVPHPLSSASSQRWRYRKEIENIGRVTFVAIASRP